MYNTTTPDQAEQPEGRAWHAIYLGSQISELEMTSHPSGPCSSREVRKNEWFSLMLA